MKNYLILASVVSGAMMCLLNVGCTAEEGSTDDLDVEETAASELALTSDYMVGDWTHLPTGYQCVVGARKFFESAFGVSFPRMPDHWTGDCADFGACHLWLDAEPDPALWEKMSEGYPSTYDLIVYPPHGANPYGHVAIVDHVEGGEIYVMDTNYAEDEQRSTMPHTVSWPEYGWYRLRSLSGGGATGGGGDLCAGRVDGLYCGADGSTLHRCSGGHASIEQDCGSGCEVMPPGTNDRCADDAGASHDCSGLADGLYCGGDGATLYRCSGGSASVEAVCASGCEVMPPGTNDRCW
ncbi:CHAP domain-containing protein [Sorangium sp. So ce388]|uniref:CHAP domain-containing protein n=1 Tax=Sorangium sp. So ce388 TaxID=3133309 RepID=UPI003F5BE071